MAPSPDETQIDMRLVDISFKVRGIGIPREHEYPMFSAISDRLGSEVTHGDSPLQFSRICSLVPSNDIMMLTKNSRLWVRTPICMLGACLRLSGKFLKIGRSRVHLTPDYSSIRGIVPSDILFSHRVIIKHRNLSDASQINPQMHEDAVQRQLDGLDVQGAISVQNRRTTVRIKGRVIVGYPVLLRGLSDQGSMIVQSRGIGGHRHIGCGIFFRPSERHLEEIMK